MKSLKNIFIRTVAGKSRSFIIFWCLIIFLFFLIPILSLNAGISGDEPVHYKHGEYVYNYFASLGEDKSAINTPQTNLKYYGQSLDNISYALVKWLDINQPYKFRHILSSIVGWLTILFAGLLARLIGGYSAGILTIIFLFISPVFLGHSFNNLKDIPFAFSYIFFLYYLIKFLKEFPKPTIKSAIFVSLGIAIAISIRAGGLMLIVYLLLFSTIQYIITNTSSPVEKTIINKKGLRILLLLILISVAGYFAGLLLWPYALQNPISHPIESMGAMTRYEVNIRQLFEGQLIWSADIPWYYIPKYFFITNPLIVLLGGLVFTIFMRSFLVDKTIKSIFIYLAFALIFPLVFVIISKSNLYGGWRHLLFIYPVFVIFSSAGYIYLIRTLKSDLFKIFIFLLVVGGIILPVRHIINNHPYEYIYFNEFAGGVNNSYSRYETDYYYHSMAEASEWLKEHLSEETQLNKYKIRIGLNFQPDIYFPEKSENIEAAYIRYYTRGSNEWDYAIFCVSYIHPFQLKNNIWPPENTIYSVKVDDKTICAVLSRISTDDFDGIKLYNKKDYEGAVELLTKAVNKDPANEQALIYLSKSYSGLRNFKKSKEVILKCLDLCPDLEQAIQVLGLISYDQAEYHNAIKVFTRNTEFNNRYSKSWEYLGYCYSKINNIKKAIYNLQKALSINSSNTIAGKALVELLIKSGNIEEAEKYRRLLKL